MGIKEIKELLIGTYLVLIVVLSVASPRKEYLHFKIHAIK